MAAIFGPGGPIILPWTVRGDHFSGGTVHGVTASVSTGNQYKYFSYSFHQPGQFLGHTAASLAAGNSRIRRGGSEVQAHLGVRYLFVTRIILFHVVVGIAILQQPASQPHVDGLWQQVLVSLVLKFSPSGRHFIWENYLIINLR